MGDVNKKIKQIGDASGELSSVNWAEYLDYVAANPDDDLMKIIQTEETSEFIAELTLEQLLHLPFNKAHELICKFNITKRIDVLNQVNTYREYLYEQISKYGNSDLSKDEQLGPRDFRLLLGKIKHLEIVQNWLFGII